MKDIFSNNLLPHNPDKIVNLYYCLSRLSHLGVDYDKSELYINPFLVVFKLIN